MAAKECSIYTWIENLLQDGTAFPPNTMSANLLVRILRAAVADGGNRREMLGAIGLDEVKLRNPFSRISSVVTVQFFRMLQQHFKDPAAHLRLGDRAAMQNFSEFGYVTRLEADLASVISAHIKLQPLRQTIAIAQFNPMARPPCLLWEFDVARREELATIVEFSVMTYARLSRQVLGEPPVLHAVHFQHQPQFDVTRYENAFGCPVSFGMPETRMEIAVRQMFRPSRFANRVLIDAASKRYEEPVSWLLGGKPYLARSYFYLTSEIDKSPPTLDRMAASLGESERSLRRRLVHEGMGFRDLLDRVRKDLCALYALEGQRAIGEIALLLGYSEISAFTRAYKRWYGVAPSKHDA